MRVLRDRVDDYLACARKCSASNWLRCRESLQVSAAESLLNRVISPHARASSVNVHPTRQPLSDPVVMG